MEPEAKPEILPEPESWPEPGPIWDKAYLEWQWGWGLHVYGFATIFLLMGLYAGYYFVLQVYHGFNKKYLSVSLNVLIVIFGFSRAFVLYFDPYHQGDIIEAVLPMRIMWSCGAPCLTSADSVVLLALVETAKLKVAPPKIQKFKYIATIIISHFAIVLITDTVVSAAVEAKAMLLMCQIIFVVWGSVLGIAYFIVGRQLDEKLFSHKQVKDTRDKEYIYLIYASGMANFFLCVLMLYSAFGVFGVYSDVKFVDEWPWYAFQTASRFLEGVACVLVFTVSAKRTRVKKTVEEMEQNETAVASVAADHETGTCKAPPSSQPKRLSMFSALQETSQTVRQNGTLPEVTEEESTTVNENGCERETSANVILVQSKN